MGGWLGRMLLLSGCLVSGMVLADEPFLKIKGDGCCNGEGEVVLTRAEFEALPQTEVRTQTPWTEGGSHLSWRAAARSGQDIWSQGGGGQGGRHQ